MLILTELIFDLAKFRQIGIRASSWEGVIKGQTKERNNFFLGIRPKYGEPELTSRIKLVFWCGKSAQVEQLYLDGSL